MDALAHYQMRNFFKQFSPVTQEDCDKAAIAISSGATITPTSTQGSQSYTVRASTGANSFIIQFRDPNYALDVDLVIAAQETYGQLVPIYQPCDAFLEPLRIYTMNDVSGDALLRCNSYLHQPENFHLLQKTVQDFAAFCASAWHSQPASMPLCGNRTSIQSDYLFRLDRIANDLPSRFQSLLGKLKSQVPSLFAHGYPLVLNHWDLLENNIHVDKQTGRITGIVDWRDAKTGPFATQFWGLENIVGIRRSTYMDFHQRHVELRTLFWERLFQAIGHVPGDFVDAIRTARMVGIFLANGDLVNSPEDERERDLAVLESLTLKLHDIGLQD